MTAPRATVRPRHTAGMMVPRHSPKPMPAKPRAAQCARRITSSPSSRKRRVSPPGSVSGSRPAAGDLQQAAELARRRAGDRAGAEAGRPAAGCSRCRCDARRAAPASSRVRARCWRRADAAPAPSRASPASAGAPRARCRARRPPGRRRRRGRAAAPDRPPAAAAAAARNGASASGVTTHGEIVVQKLFARNGPSGWYSQPWMSRADQSLSRQKPAMCCRGLGDRDRLRRARCPARSRRRVRARSRGCARGRSSARSRSPACAGRSGGDGMPRRHDRRGAAVIADRHVLVVRQQRIVGAEQLAGVGRVVDAGEEIRVVADRGRQPSRQSAAGCSGGRAALDARALRAFGVEQVADAPAQRRTRRDTCLFFVRRLAVGK